MRILIIRFSSLGDITMATALPRVLRNKFPDAEIDFATAAEFKDIIDAFKDTDYILSTNLIKRFMRILTILGSIVVPFVVIFSVDAIFFLLGSPNNDFIAFIIPLVLTFLVSGSTLYILHQKRLI